MPGDLDLVRRLLLLRHENQVALLQAILSILSRKSQQIGCDRPRGGGGPGNFGLRTVPDGTLLRFALAAAPTLT